MYSFVLIVYKTATESVVSKNNAFSSKKKDKIHHVHKNYFSSKIFQKKWAVVLCEVFRELLRFCIKKHSCR